MLTFTRFHRFEFRALCWFLAALMFAAPSLPVLAQEQKRKETRTGTGRPDTTLLADPATAPAVQPLDLTYLLPQACFVLAARPRQLLTAPAAAMLPIEVLQAASLQQTGLDPLEMETVLLSMEPPIADPPNYALLATFTNSVEGKLNPQLTAHTQPGQLDGRQYFKSQNPLMPSIYSIDGKTLLVTPELMLQKLVATETSPTGNLLAERLKAAATDDLYAAINIEMLRPMINQLLMQAPVPPEFQHFYPAPDLIRLVELRVNLSGMGPTELVVEANNAADAEKLVTMLKQTIDMWRSKALKEIEQLKQNPDPVQQALGRYQERMMNQMSGMFLPKPQGARLVLFHVDPSENPQGPMVTVAIAGVLVALLLPAVQAAREAARRNASMNNMKQIMLALLNHEDRTKHFPAYANFDANGKPLLSWRVLILRELEEGDLYKQFHLDEPWDSEHNRQLISKMPAVYLDPSSRHQREEGKTNYLGVKGKGCMFEGTQETLSMYSVRDGTSNTMMILQVNDDRAAIWTKPDDWELNEQDPLQGLKNSLHPGIFLAGFCDGRVRAISDTIDLSVFKALLTRAGGEVVNAGMIP
jgi:Protein of unknown function (DUF1559)